MYAALSNRLLSTAIVCSLLLQGCGSGLRAITEEPVLKQDPPTTADPVQASGEAMLPGALVLVPSREDTRVNGASGSMSPTKLAAAVVPAYRRVFMGPFTASSGERVLLSQQQGQWQALLQGGAGAVVHGRVLPVVGSGDIGTLLSSLQGQDVWSSRSRIHVLPAPFASSTPCVYVGKLGLLGGAPEAAVEEKDKWVLGPRLLIKSSGTKDVAAYQIPSGYRYRDYRVKEEVLGNVEVLKIYYVEANNEEEVHVKLEDLKNRLVAGELSADVNLPLGYPFNVGNFKAGAGNAVVKSHGSTRVQRSKHAALVVCGSTKENPKFSRQKEKSNIHVVLEVRLEKDETLLQDVPLSPTNALNHAQPNPHATYPLVNVLPAFMTTSWPAASFSSQEQLQRDYEDQLYEVRASRDRAASALAEKEKQLNTKTQAYKCLSEAHAALEASRAALEQECAERLSTAAEEHERQLAHQTSLLKQKEAQLNTKTQAYECLVEAHAALEASRAALEQECAERLSTAAEEHERQLAHQTSLLKQKEAQLHTQEQEHQRLAEDHAALQTALAREYEKLAAAESARQTAASALAEKEQECEQLTAAAEEHERQLAHQESLYQTAETACQTAETSLKQKERDYERLVEAYQQLAQVLVSSVVFGEKQWEQYFGKVGTAPRLPIEIGEVLSSPCPFCPDQQVKDTHLLVLIPSTVNDKPFSLNLLGELIRKPKAGNYRTKYRYYDRGVQDVLGNKQSFNHSYWVLITRDVLPSSRKKRYGDQKGLIAGHVHYDVPYALEAATAALLHYARTGKPLYTADPWTYTRCQDLVDNYPTVVGGFNGSGLSVSYDFSDDSVDRYGVAGCRRFSYQP